MSMITNMKMRRGWRDVLDRCRTTVGKPAQGKEPSEKFKRWILRAEHSPIRVIEFEWTFKDIPTFVATHLVRHHEGCEKFVRSQRTDRTGIDRNKLTQDAPIDMDMVCNTQALINISRKRLCNKASIETRNEWMGVKKAVTALDAEIGAAMVRECVYRGFCPEGKSCGYTLTSLYEKEIKEYRDGIQ